MIVRSSREISERASTSSVCSTRETVGLPGFEACNAAIAPSLATVRIRVITVRSTPSSVAAAPWVICPVKTRTNTSYFCSTVKNRFVLRGVAIGVSPFLQGQQPCHMMLERTRILSREVRGIPLGRLYALLGSVDGQLEVIEIAAGDVDLAFVASAVEGAVVAVDDGFGGGLSSVEVGDEPLVLCEVA